MPDLTPSLTIGCDLGNRTSTLCILPPSGDVLRPKPLRTTPQAFTEFFSSHPPALVVLEVGGHSRWVSELLTRLGHRVVVANPRRVKLISQNDSKTDRNDAELLARLGRADVELLKPITHRSMEAQADLAVAKARDALVAVRTQLVNHARGTAKSFGCALPKCEAVAFHRTARAAVPALLKPALDPIFATLESLHAQIQTHERQLKVLAKRYPDVELLQQVHGVGLLTALVFVLTIEDKTRFKKSRTAGAFFGLRPRKDQSGDTDRQLRITKAGDPFGRRLLVQSAQHILGPFGADSDLRRWGLELAARGGMNGKKRAVVAIARKLAVLLHRLWVTGEEYEPLRNAKARQAMAA